MNINSEKIPKEVTNPATSLKIEYDREFSTESIVSEFCNLFEKKFEELLV